MGGSYNGIFGIKSLVIFFAGIVTRFILEVYNPLFASIFTIYFELFVVYKIARVITDQNKPQSTQKKAPVSVSQPNHTESNPQLKKRSPVISADPTVINIINSIEKSLTTIFGDNCPSMFFEETHSGFVYYFDDCQILVRSRQEAYGKLTYLKTVLDLHYPSFNLESVDLRGHFQSFKRVPQTHNICIAKKHDQILKLMLRSSNFMIFLETLDYYFTDATAIVSADKMTIEIFRYNALPKDIISIIKGIIVFYKSAYRGTSRPLPKISDTPSTRCIICFQAIVDNAVQLACCQSVIHQSHVELLSSRCPYCRQQGLILV